MFGGPPTSQDIPLNPAAGDSISSLCWHPGSGVNQPSFIAAGAWDKQVRLWEVQPSGQSAPKAAIDHGAPVLSVSVSANNIVFSGGCDNKVMAWDLPSNSTLQVAQHDAPVKFVSWLPDANVLLSGSWDKTLRYWDCRSSVASCTVILPERLYGADAKGNVVAAATAERKILVYDIRQPANAVHQFESPLKFQTRCIALSTDSTTLAIGSIEGRVALRHLDNTMSGENFSWKCHRESEIIHSVHAVDFHPTNKNTLASVGGDCKFAFWDLNRKKNVYTSPAASLPITCGKFHQSGRVFAYAASYDWQRGTDGYAQQAQNLIYLHPVLDNEVS